MSVVRTAAARHYITKGKRHTDMMTPIFFIQHGRLAKYMAEEAWYPQTVPMEKSGLVECDYASLDVWFPTL